MGIFPVFFYNFREILDSLLMISDHLVRLGPLVNILDVCGYHLDGLSVRIYGLLELLSQAVCQTNVVIDVRFVRWEWFSFAFECLLQRVHALLILFISE